MHRLPKSSTRDRRRVRPVLAAALISGTALSICLPPLTGQERPGADLPVIEPVVRTLIESDTLRIQEAVLSPDGNWVVYSAGSPSGRHLWVIPITGGESRLLVETRNVTDPIWFPDGRRIAYRSGRTGNLTGFAAVMTVPFDSETGEASGPPRRVTLDPVPSSRGSFRISPDGSWIAFKTMPEDGGMIVKVLPANGGPARTIAVERTNRVFLQDWSADGRFVYYRRRHYEAPDSYQLLRASVDGGEPELITEIPSDASGPEVPFRVSRVSTDVGQAGHEIQTFLEEPVARLQLARNASAMDPGVTFSHDASKLLAVVSNAVRPLRILPVAGGPPFQVGETQSWNKPLGWSTHGGHVYFSSIAEGPTALLSFAVDGGETRELGPMPDIGPPVRDLWGVPIIFSADGKYLSYSRPTPGSPYRTLLVRAVEGGEERVITRALRHHEAFGLAGPGGAPLVLGDEFLYYEAVGDEQWEIRAVHPEGPSRLLGSGSVSDPVFAFGVFEDRVAYAWGDSLSRRDPFDPATAARIKVAKGPSGALKDVAVIPGAVAFDDIVWSHNGKWIAANTYFEGDPDSGGMKVVVVGVGPDGEVTVPYRVIDTPMYGSAWSLRWLPDDSAVILYGQSLPDWGSDIWLVPVKNGGRPVALTRDETGSIGYHVLSPDGRHIAYQVGIPGGSSLVLVDLGDGLKEFRR